MLGRFPVCCYKMARENQIVNGPFCGVCTAKSRSIAARARNMFQEKDWEGILLNLPEINGNFLSAGFKFKGRFPI